MEDFDQQVKNAGSKLVVVDFFATWCSPCKRVEPFLKEYAETYADKIEVLKVDVDQLDDLAARYGVKSMPTFTFLKDGKVADQFFGAIPEAVENTIKQLLGLEQEGEKFNLISYHRHYSRHVKNIWK